MNVHSLLTTDGEGHAACRVLQALRVPRTTVPDQHIAGIERRFSNTDIRFRMWMDCVKKNGAFQIENGEEILRVRPGRTWELVITKLKGDCLTDFADTAEVHVELFYGDNNSRPNPCAHHREVIEAPKAVSSGFCQATFHVTDDVRSAPHEARCCIQVNCRSYGAYCSHKAPNMKTRPFILHLTIREGGHHYSIPLSIISRTNNFRENKGRRTSGPATPSSTDSQSIPLSPPRSDRFEVRETPVRPVDILHTPARFSSRISPLRLAENIVDATPLREQGSSTGLSGNPNRHPPSPLRELRKRRREESSVDTSQREENVASGTRSAIGRRRGEKEKANANNINLLLRASKRV